MSKLTHISSKGDARMVDVSAKASTSRIAIARGRVSMQAETLKLVLEGNARKGDVLAIARIAGIMAAKRTHELIPLCHPLMISTVSVELAPDVAGSAIDISATVKVEGKTGVEMEALTAVSVAALTIYDMCKSADRAMRISDIRVVEKQGGKSSHYQAD